MKYLFILGRDIELSLEELKVFLKDSEILAIDNNFLIAELKTLPSKLIEELGGTIKIAEIISEAETLNELEDNLNHHEFFQGSKNKPFYYITNYSDNFLEFVKDYLREYFKDQRLKATYKKPKSNLKKVSPTELYKNGFPNQCIEIILYKNIVAQTVQVTNPAILEKRDILRPNIDYSYSISLRLAKILINLSEIKANQMLLDPFCNIGTILQEALIKKINIIGIERDPELFKKAEKNIRWLKKEYNLRNNSKLINLPCKDLAQCIPKNSIDAIVNQPNLGPKFSKTPTDDQTKKIISSLEKLYFHLFVALNLILKKNKKCIFITPLIITNSKKAYSININKLLKNNLRLKKTITLFEKNNIIQKEIHIITK